MVEQLTYIAEYMAEHHPDVIVLTTNHGTAGEPTPHYGVRYFDLPRFAPPNLGVKVHTLMFYDLQRPAPVYGNEDFHFLFDFMVSEYRTRNLVYFPEAAWWLTFDIAVPLYLPITVEARSRDLELIRFMLDGKLIGHRSFGTGHEWGYWQNEYCSLRMAHDLDYDWRDCFADIASPMGEAATEVQAVLEALVGLQERDIIYGDLIRWLVGSDPETEAAARVGIDFHPLPPSPGDVAAWDRVAVDQFRTVTAARLAQMDVDHSALLARLDAVREQVPEDAMRFFAEIHDGIAINGLRARHAMEAYGAMVEVRAGELGDGDLETAGMLLEMARTTSEAALEVIAGREAMYRYAPLERATAGGPELDEDENWTDYRYRYLARTHHAWYWTRVDEQAETVVHAPPAIIDAVLGPDDSLQVRPGGAQSVVTNPDGDAVADLDAAPPGRYGVTVSSPGHADLVVEVARVDAEARTTGMRVTAPEALVGNNGRSGLIDDLLPVLAIGTWPERLVIGFAERDAAFIGPGDWTDVPRSDDEPSAGPVDLEVPLFVNGAVATRIRVVGARLAYPDDAPITIAGALSTSDVIDAVVEVANGAFDPNGARALLAQILGTTPDMLPETVDFSVEAARE